MSILVQCSDGVRPVSLHTFRCSQSSGKRNHSSSYNGEYHSYNQKILISSDSPMEAHLDGECYPTINGNRNSTTKIFIPLLKILSSHEFDTGMRASRMENVCMLKRVIGVEECDATKA